MWTGLTVTSVPGYPVRLYDTRLDAEADLQRVLGDLCEESDAAAEAMRLRAVLERIAHPKTGRDVWVKLIAEEALRGRDDGKAT